MLGSPFAAMGLAGLGGAQFGGLQALGLPGMGYPFPGHQVQKRVIFLILFYVRLKYLFGNVLVYLFILVIN